MYFYLIQLWAYEEPLHCLTTNQLLAPYEGEKVVSAGKELETRVEKIENFLRKFLEDMIAEVGLNVFKESVVNFLGDYVEDGAHIIANKQHFDFELIRLEFNTWGALKKMDVKRRRMILTFWVMIHVMLPMVFTMPWEVDRVKYPPTPRRRLNLRFTASIVYHFFMDEFREMPKDANNQEKLTNKMRNDARLTKYRLGSS